MTELFLPGGALQNHKERDEERTRYSKAKEDLFVTIVVKG
jgi:hypothetical protein